MNGKKKNKTPKYKVNIFKCNENHKFPLFQFNVGGTQKESKNKESETMHWSFIDEQYRL